MNNLLDRIAQLINVKTIVTLAVIFVFAVLSLRGSISVDFINNVVVMVIGFYFGTQHEKQNLQQ